MDVKVSAVETRTGRQREEFRIEGVLLRIQPKPPARKRAAILVQLN